MSLFRLSLPSYNIHTHPKNTYSSRSSKGSVHNSHRKNATNYSQIHKRSVGTTVTGPVATVFGCTGFMGPYVVETLARRGVQIVTPYRGEEKYINPLKPLGEVGQIVPFRYDIRDQNSVERAVSHSNIVINLLGREWETRNFTFQTANVDSAVMIAQAAKKAGVQRLVYFSCIGADVHSESQFARAKGAAERLTFDIFPEATIIRPTPIIGQKDRFLNRYGRLARYSKFVLSLYPKQTKVQPVWANDVVDALDKILASERTEGQIFELGGPGKYTVEEIIIGCLDELERGNQGYFTGGAIQIPEKLALLIARVMQNARDPLWIEDQIKYHKRDLVVSNNPRIGTFKDLEIKPHQLEYVGPPLLQVYKKPSRFLKE